MTDKSIIFSAESVRAIFEGRKTQHRIVVKYQFPGSDTVECGIYHPIGVDKDGIVYPKTEQFGAWSDNADIKCPYQIGQKLWVREKFSFDMNSGFGKDGYNKASYSLGYADGTEKEIIWEGKRSDTDPYVDFFDKQQHEWCSPVAMPRWASRLSLEVTDIRCERVQGITREDALAEGMTGTRTIGDYEMLWDTTNAKRGYPWDSNPWAWVIDFKEVSV